MENRLPNRGKQSKRCNTSWLKRMGQLAAIFCLSVLLLAGCGDDEASEASPGEEEPLKIQFPKVDRDGLTEKRVVAVYDQGEIRGDELADFLAVQAFMHPLSQVNDREAREQFLNLLIAQRLIVADMSGEDLSWAEKEAGRLWNQVEAAYDQETMERAYATLQIDEQDVRQYLYDYAVMQQYLREQLTEEERTVATVRHILISTRHELSDAEAKEKAYELYRQLKEGADFAQLAREHTEDQASKASGGLMESTPVYLWVPQFRQAVLSQEVDQIGEPVQTEYGFHIIKVEERQVKELDELEENELMGLTAQRLVRYLEEELPGRIEEINL